jgi:excisionase family DNA binding protein
MTNRLTVAAPVPRYVSMGEAAELLGVTDRTIRNLISRGVLPAYRLGGKNRVRIKLSDVETALTRVPVTGGPR